MVLSCTEYCVTFLAIAAAMWFLISIETKKKTMKKGHRVIWIERPKISLMFKRRKKIFEVFS